MYICVVIRVCISTMIRRLCFNVIHVFLFAFWEAMSWCFFKVQNVVLFWLSFCFCDFSLEPLDESPGGNQVDGLPPALRWHVKSCCSAGWVRSRNSWNLWIRLVQPYFPEVFSAMAFDWSHQIAKRICNEGAELEQGVVPWNRQIPKIEISWNIEAGDVWSYHFQGFFVRWREFSFRCRRGPAGGRGRRGAGMKFTSAFHNI